MDIFSKIKKFEEADYFNQNLSNVLIDEDRDKFTIGHELIEESDYFNQNLSNVLIDEDRDKFTIGHELIDDSDYFNSNLSNVLLDTSSDIFADSFVLNDEEFDFFNQNLNNALIEDVDLDSIVDTLSLVETASQQSAVKYYKVEITKTPSTYTTATLSNGRFNGLRFKETTSTFETNAISENVVFTDSNNHDINAVVEYLNGRTESNNNSYNPSAFFVEDVSQSWGGTPWNTIEGDTNEDLIYQVIFQSKIQLNDIKTLTFNDINDDNVSVNIKIYESNDLETWELLQDTDISYDSELNEYNYDYESSYSSVDPTDTYKIVLTTNPDTSPEGGLALGKFTELVYVDCLTPQSYDNLSEDIVFTDGNNNYNCTVSVNGRFPHKKQDYYAPHNFFAPSNKRVCPVSNIYCYYGERLIVTIKFTDPIAYSKIQELGFRFGHEANEYVPDAVQYDLYNSSDKLLYSVTKLKSDTDSNRDITITAESPSNDAGSDPTANWKIILTGNPDKMDDGGFSLASFTDLEYVECLTAQSYSNLSEDVVFTDGENNYNCTISLNSRFPHEQNDYYAPHNLFAPSDKRICSVSNVDSEYGVRCIVTIEFTDPIAFSKIKSLNFRMGYESSSNYNAPDSVQYDLYNGDDELAYTTTKLLSDADSNRDITIVASLNSEDDVNHKFKIEFTNFTVGQYINFIATSITGLEFYENRVTDRKTDIVKIYKDADGNEFPVHIYAEPKVDHNYYNSNDLVGWFQYNNNISSSDKIVIEFDTIINNINANGKIIHFESPSNYPQYSITLNVYSDDTLLYSDTRLFDMANVEINTDSQN